MYNIVPTTKFQKDLKARYKAWLRKYSFAGTDIIKKLGAGEPLPERNRHHGPPGTTAGRPGTGKTLFGIEEAAERTIIQYLLSDGGQIAHWPTDRKTPHAGQGALLRTASASPTRSARDRNRPAHTAGLQIQTILEKSAYAFLRPVP